MKPILPPLKPGDSGPEVRNLQDGLLLLIVKGHLQIPPDILPQLIFEQQGLRFGSNTQKTVTLFQQQRQLNQNGEVDAPTADALNQLLKEIGALVSANEDQKRMVAGQVMKEDGAPLKGRVVRAFHKSEQISIRLGEDITDAQGRYTIRYELLPGITTIDLSVSVLDQDESPLVSSEIRNNAAALETIDLNLPALEQPPWRVFGTVRDAQGEVLTGVKVQAFDRHLRTETLLDEAPVTDGRYEIQYKQSQLQPPGKDSADLILKVLRQNEELHKTTVHHHAPHDFELNFTIKGAAYEGPSEWESLKGTFMPQLHDIAPSDLREDETFQDFSFLAGETGKDRLSVAMWAMCFRLADQTRLMGMDLEPEVLFALLRSGQPFVLTETFIADMQHADRRTLLEQKILSGLGAIAPDQHRSLIETAIANNVIPGRFRLDVEKTLGSLHRINLHYAAQKPFGGGKGTINELLELTPEAKERQDAFMMAFTAHEGSLDTFWEKLSGQQVLPAEIVPKVQLSFELGALTRNHIPLVREIAGRFANGAMSKKRELAKLSRDQWKEIFRKQQPNGEIIGVPANIDGETAEERMDLFAASLDRQFERAYPTASFAGKLSRNELSPLGSTAEMVRFFDNNPDLHFDRVRLDKYLSDVGPENALQGIQDKDAAVANLKSIQRVFKLDPTFKTVNALLTRKIDSSQQIYFMGESQFVKAMADSDVNKLEAKRLYRKAENAYAYALAMYGDYNRALNGPSPQSVPSLVPNAADQSRITALPNLQTLFGSLDYCECVHCSSVYSPAAYFVDVMRFLGARGTQGTAVNAGKNVRQVLLERRPDLGEIELSCENTNTPLPYIDLVNEILEDLVAPPSPVVLSGAIEPDLIAGLIKPSILTELEQKGVPVSADAQVLAQDARNQWAIRDGQHAYKISKSGAELHLLRTRQTFLSAAELRANPEYTNTAAYDRLKGEVFPLSLPFDLWQVQVRTYLNHLGVPQPRLQTLFQQTPNGTSSPTDLQIDCSWLGITEKERQILTGTISDFQPWDFWGLKDVDNDLPNPENPADPSQNIKGTWIEVLRHVNVMLNRTGLAYKELLQLLDLDYINPTRAIVISDTGNSNAANCDTSNFRIENLTEDSLNRVHRFIRLSRKVGCAMWELDLLLPDADTPGAIDKQITDAALQDISHIRRLQEQTSLDWRTILSFYSDIDHKVYLDRNREGAPPVQSLYERLFRNKLVDAIAGFPPSPNEITGKIEERIPGILAAFRIKESDLSLILADHGLVVTNNLNIEVLSRIHRITALAHSLGLDIDQFLRLKRLWRHDPFANPLATLQFAELAQKIAASNFTVLELDYLLHHQFTSNSGVALDDGKIVSVMTSIREGLQEIKDGTRLKPEETKEAYVRNKLGLLPALEKDAEQAVALGLIDDTWSGSNGNRETLITQLFAGVLDPVQAKEKLAKLPDTLTPDQRDAAIIERFSFVQSGLEAFLLQTENEALIQQMSAEMLQLDVPSTSLLLDELQVIPGTVLLRTINDPRLLETNGDRTFTKPIDVATFPDIFKSFRRLHKNAMVIDKLDLKALDVRRWLNNKHSEDMGWMKANDLPIDHSTKVDLELWLAMQQFYAWQQQLPKSDITALEFANTLTDETKKSDDIISTLAKLTGWSEVDLKSLRSAFNWEDAGESSLVIRAKLQQSSNLIRLADCMRALRRLGVSADRALQWAKAEPNSEDAESLKQTVKAKYDLKQWQKIIQPIQDDFREQKRQALVTWLVTHPKQIVGQNWSDTNGLYSYLLIDVEMSASMLTSRLKQAAASAQLFVQRCLLNLEHDIVAKTGLDLKWKQWKWMKQYRVWEANRKVFLYPENWIEPELRDEKSPFFKELENELAQNDITNETAEQAYLNYLEKLDQVANLEIRAIYNQEISQNESVLHVFGRTRSSVAPQYYYRKQINKGRWTAWENVGLDINANHLVAGFQNRRLYLMWPQFLTKADIPASVPNPTGNNPLVITEPNKYWEVRLFWSELKKGKWTPKVLSDSFVRVDHWETGGEKPENMDFSPKFGTSAVVSIVRSFHPERGAAPTSAVRFFEKSGKQITPQPIRSREIFKAPTDSRYFNNLLQHTGTSHLFGHFSESVPLDSGVLNLNPQSHATSSLVLKGLRGTTYSAVDLRGGPVNPNGSFFLWDTERVYFVDYWRREDQVSNSRGGWDPVVTASFSFFIHYHPFVELFIKELNIWGIKGLLNRRIQTEPTNIFAAPPAFKFDDYQPTSVVAKIHKLPDGSVSYPVEEVDFSYMGAYASYNWELFFHVPFFIANKLSANQRFEEALEWFHYIFDPTSTDNAVANSDTPQQKFWITKPFYETTKADYYKQKIENIMLAIAKGDVEFRKQVEEWRDNPFNPHLIARMRTTAYQKNVVIKYIQTLIAWADQLFRRDTIESINEATQLYILAASVLGPRPKSIPRRDIKPAKTFYQLEQEGIDSFGNVLKEVENLVPNVSSANTQGEDTPELPRLDVLYFGIPNNDKLLTLWDTVADRLFKVRHGMNIDGIVRQLPLFEPPIDPALLVRAVAMGIDISAAMSDVNAPLPLYRFNFMIQRALEICADVKALGSAMLAAVEKRDAEAFALLRSTHEQVMLAGIRLIKDYQDDEALRSKEALIETKKLVEERRLYYDQLINDGLNSWEITSLSMTGGAIAAEIGGTILNAIGSGTSMIPEVNAGASGFGGSPHLTLSLGGKSVTSSVSKAADVLKGVASILQTSAGMTSTIGSHKRRSEEWTFQRRLAEKELPQLDKQIAAADIRYQIAEQDLKNHDRQIENAQKEDEYLHTKFTNNELYDWMLNQISTVYFQTYQLAYDMAKRAERCFRYELGLSDSNYIQFGYWDSLRKGLLSGERLHYDLKRLETAYYEQHRREFELTKHISLAQLDPTALLQLSRNGECFLDIPETVFDMDYPGHYFRRLKSVGLSIPCVAGPYTTVACTLTLIGNHLRKDSTLLGDKYARDLTIEDPRFRDEIAAIQSIATSNAQNDHGMFDLNFRDERYLPFEGAGAISSWHIKLNKDFQQFDYSTISDVIIHLSYTAREGGELLRSKAVAEFNQKMNELALAEDRKGLFRVFDLKREYSAQWSRFLRPSNPADDQALMLDGLSDRLPFFTRTFNTKNVVNVELVAKMKGNESYTLSLAPFSNDELPLSADNTYQGLHRAMSGPITQPVKLNTSTIKIKETDAADFKSLPVDAIEELFLIINYTIA